MSLKSLCLGPGFPVVVVLLTSVSCGLFDGKPYGSRPTQVMDLPSMIGKSAPEITTMVGKPPNKDDKVLGVDWELAEGRLSLSHISGTLPSPYRTRFIRYELKPYTGFAPDRGVATPEEMAALVNMDFQGRKGEQTRSGLAYRNLNVNGTTVDLTISARGERYMGAVLSYDE